MPKLPLWAYIIGGLVAIGVANYFNLIATERLVASVRRIGR